MTEFKVVKRIKNGMETFKAQVEDGGYLYNLCEMGEMVNDVRDYGEDSGQWWEDIKKVEELIKTYKGYSKNVYELITPEVPY